MRKLAIALVPLLLVAVVIGGIGCGGEGGDEQEVVNVIKRQVRAFNDKDWYTAYETMSPNYRATFPYEDFTEYSEAAWALWLVAFGPGKLEVTDISVRVEGEWAYATLKLLWNGDVVHTYTSASPDIYRKVNDRWYDVAEDPMEPGYNVDDVP